EVEGKRGRERSSLRNRPVADTRLIREWKGVEHSVTVRNSDFEYQGRPYKSLSAVAKHITGTQWNGLVFFGLIQRWRAERNAIARGIKILEQSALSEKNGKKPTDPEVIPLTAWRFMNEAFEKFWSRKNKNVAKWRLFQIAFILTQIPAIVSRLA